MSLPGAENASHLAFVFGPQALGFDFNSFDKLRLNLQESSNNWALGAVSSLPQFWGSLLERVPKLQHLDGQRLLQELDQGLGTGKISQTLIPMPNILLTPLVVISHLTQYVAFLKAALPDLADDDVLPSSIVDRKETLGLCTGILSAFAVSCSSTLAELQHYGAVAVRLAMLAGALVDAEEASPDSNGAATSFSVAWNGTDSSIRLKKVLEQFPQAYVSVFMDERRSTVTASKIIAPELTQQLKNAGIHVTAIPLAGRFHWQGHQEDVEQLISFCDGAPGLQLPDASEMVLPNRAISQVPHPLGGTLHEIALREILLHPAEWLKTFSSCDSSGSNENTTIVFCFGPERCIPPTRARKLGSQLIHVSDIDLLTSSTPTSHDGSSNHTPLTPSSLEELPDDRIAVIGMACHVPGAEDIDEFWRILANGKSQHREVPAERFPMATAFREVTPDQKWYGNFIDDYDSFDHKFFKKSPREMASTDPQHRLILKLAYQAVEQSGYFGISERDTHIGCYIGVGNVDYDRNIACAPANAYSATGNLRSFAAGKVSHYFGWTGPALTIDTACSSSSVAVHQACRAIINGECSSALAGGVNVLTNAEWFHNLAGASFLSPTGQCKPFDARADGYCRGEGAGVVLLKKLSSAIADDDQILGVIASTKVYQNQNCTAITVPNAISLSELFVDVIRQARLEPQSISVVEAHGTGTQAGDPAEYDGVRTALGGSIRSDTLSLTSVKGLLGHAEFASGVLSLIKVLLMINKGFIPPQASFATLNPALKVTPGDNIEIPTRFKPWDVKFRSALINNYGASGSNASMVITQPPRPFSTKQDHLQISAPVKSFPFWFCGLDTPSIRAYVVEVKKFLQRHRQSGKDLSAANLSFQLYRQSNRTLPNALILNASSSNELEEKLSAFEHGDKNIAAIKLPPPRPVVLCFGGQNSTYVGLSEDLYHQIAILRYHLDGCNSVCVSLGLDSIYPAIFQKSPIQDVVMLQTVLFATQYSCAKSWIDCGVNAAAIVGHSFGELTGLCIAGVYSLTDALKLISGRARLIQDHWSSDPGSMLAVAADHADVVALVEMAKRVSGGTSDVSIACYNGPRSFTLAGSTEAVESTYDLAQSNESFSGMKLKRLKVTNAFHSALVNPLMQGLGLLGHDVVFNDSTIAIERATEFKTAEKPEVNFVAQHMRNPVYFNHAVQRISKAHPKAIWLEAGSNSTITAMVSGALQSRTPGNHFQSINLSSDNSFEPIVNATADLWKEGLNVAFWAHHTKQSADYSLLLLPPYQFEKSRHWMDLKQLPKLESSGTELVQPIEVPKGLTTFVTYQDEAKQSARFRVNTMTEKFQRPTSAQIVADTAAVTPGMLHLEIVLDALVNLGTDFKKLGYKPEIREVSYQNMIHVGSSAELYVDLLSKDVGGHIWKWRMHGVDSTGSATNFSSGEVVFHSADDLQSQASFGLLARLSSRTRCVDLLQSHHADEVLQGRSIYRALEHILSYKDTLRCVSKVASKGNESAGIVAKPSCRETWMDPILTESFCQVASIFVNVMTDVSGLAEKSIFVCDGFSRWIRNPKLDTLSPLSEVWEIFAVHHRESAAKYVSDVFAFDPRSETLVEAILGISFQKVPLETIRKSLTARPGTQSSTSKFTTIPTQAEPQSPLERSSGLPHAPISGTRAKLQEKVVASKQAKRTDLEIPAKTRGIISNLSGLEPEDIQDESDLVELGIDSLMAMELVREVYAVFKCTLQNDQLMELTDFRTLVLCIESALGIEQDEGREEQGVSSLDAGEAPKVNGHEHPNGINETHSQAGRNDLRVWNDTNGVNGAAGTGIVNSVGTPKSYNSLHGILPPHTVRDVFQNIKLTTDESITTGKLGGYYREVIPRSTELCIAYIIDAFEQLGCPIRSAAPGQQLERAPYLPKHEKFMTLIYEMLEKDSRLIDINGSKITRTSVAPPTKSAKTLLEGLLHDEPAHAAEHRLTALVGTRFANLITGKEDGLQLIFGTPESREITSDMYANSPINTAWIKQLENLLHKLVEQVPESGQPICILEIGAGTGGTTSKIVPLLARLGRPVKYKMTDISSSLVAAARRRFKQYPFMEFKVIDMENEPDQNLLQSQHIIIATNCVHATRDLSITLKNLHRVLQSDGFLIMLEMTQKVPCFDFVFGLLEGWWLFEDGRDYALQPAKYWEKVLQDVGYGHVDWTEGSLPEANIQRLIIAHSSGPKYTRGPKPTSESILGLTPNEDKERRKVMAAFVHKYTADFRAPNHDLSPSTHLSPQQCVLVTGATGSLGAHIIASLVRRPDIQKIVCLNRLSSSEAESRQRESLKMRGISLDPASWSKVSMIETDTSKPILGLSPTDYHSLISSVTQIVHSAWPMSLKRPIRTYESQFKIVRNLIDLAHEVTETRGPPFKFGFQFVSSSAVIANYPMWAKTPLVPEEPGTVESLPSTGYAEAKLVTEQILAATLYRYPDRFHAMVVRIAQISGSTSNGYWNPSEYLPFLIRSSQVLKLLPDLDGDFSWCPVDSVAAALVDLLMADAATDLIYHIDNLSRQPWKEMILNLASVLDLASKDIVPFEQWVDRVRRFRGSTSDNPALQLIEFFDNYFVPMSCGGLILDTQQTRKYSETLRMQGSIGIDLIEKYVARWRESGFLKP